MAWNPTFKIDLRDLIDEAYEEEVADKLRPIISEPDFKNLFGRRIVDRIVERTREEGLNKLGKEMGSYSTSYKKSLIFEIYKGKQEKVNLTLTGDMLDTMNHRNGRYEIIVQLEGEENRAKAQGHVSGKYGKNGKGKGNRDFLGLKESEQLKIFKQTMKDYRSESRLVAAELEAI